MSEAINSSTGKTKRQEVGFERRFVQVWESMAGTLVARSTSVFSEIPFGLYTENNKQGKLESWQLEGKRKCSRTLPAFCFPIFDFYSTTFNYLVPDFGSFNKYPINDCCVSGPA